MMMMLRQSGRKVLLGLTSREAASRSVGILPRFYHENVIDHYNNPRNVGSFDKNDPTFHTLLILVFSATEWVKGRAMEEVLTIKNTEIAKRLSLPPVKLHCSMLAEDAIKAAVKDYKEKRAKSNGDEGATPAEKAAEA